MNNRDERLKIWISTLSKEQLEKVAFECVDRLIETEDVGFYETTKIPYWENCGENLDGSEDKEE